MQIKVYITEGFADAVPVLASYILLQLTGYPPSKERVDEMLDEVSTAIGEALSLPCIACEADAAGCGSLVIIDLLEHDYLFNVEPVCLKCIDSVDDEVLTMEELESMTTALEKSKLQ